MSDLTLRKIPWTFDPSSTPFQWNPRNPDLGIVGNSVTFVAPPFERYIVSTVRRAQERITDPEIQEEAELFLRQEGLHARAHRNHAAALVAQYPGLKEVVDATEAGFDQLLESESLEFNLAYIAAIEATFTPLFRMMLDNEASLFAGANDEVASLLVWHFTEEIEHRSSALLIYRAVVGKDMYRTRNVRKIFGHMRGMSRITMRGFNEHVPRADRLVDAPVLPPRRGPRAALDRRLRGPRTPPFEPYGTVPKTQMWRMSYGLFMSQMPWHQPKNERLPAFAGRWFEAYDRGVDVTHWFGSQHRPQPDQR